MTYATRFMNPDYKEKMDLKREREIRCDKEVNEDMMIVAEDNEKIVRNALKLMKRDSLKLERY